MFKVLIQLCRAIIVVLIVAGVVPACGAHDNQNSSKRFGLPTNWSRIDSGPLCGVYSACRALELIGINASPQEFITRDFVGSCGGSSADEVASIVRHAGGSALIINRGSVIDLEMVSCPVIANVRGDYYTDRFNHWVVVLSIREGLLIIDGNDSPYKLTRAEFLGLWNGVGICVTPEGESPLRLMWIGRILLLLPVLVGTALLLRTCFRLQFCFFGERELKIGLVSIASAIIGNFVYGDPLNHHLGCEAACVSPHVDGIRAGVKLSDVMRGQTISDHLLIDARMESDFNHGTIAGAINIPVTATRRKIKEFLQDVNRDQPMIIFCQSSKCNFDESIALKIKSLGFANVSVCEDGYFEVQQARGEFGN